MKYFVMGQLTVDNNMPAPFYILAFDDKTKAEECGTNMVVGKDPATGALLRTGVRWTNVQMWRAEIGEMFSLPPVSVVRRQICPDERIK